MRSRIPAPIATIGVVAVAVVLCLIPAGHAVGADPLPNIWIELFSTDSTYLGQPVPVGAEILAFDSETGVQCGQFTAVHAGWFGTMACYGDDGVYPGATAGHALRFTIDGATASTEAVALNGSSIPVTTTVVWSQTRDLWEVNLHARLDVGTHTLVSSANPSNLSETVTFTTTVSGTGPGSEKPTGNVQFAADGSPLGVVALDSFGQASIGTAILASGTHTITATYEGDTIFHPSRASLIQGVGTTEERCELATGAYDFSASGPVHVEIGSLGSLVCIRVQHVPGDHPHATPATATGHYWLIEGTDSLGDPAAGFSVTLTLPFDSTPDALDKLCRYHSAEPTWDCAASSFDDVNNTVTRADVTGFSDWAVGNDVKPNAVTLRSFLAETQHIALFWRTLLPGMAGLLVVALYITTRRVFRKKGDT